MSLAFLLDVNAMIALFDEAHTEHEAAHEWFARNRSRGWRTCPITENGLLRILSHPGYPNDPVPVSDLAQRLEDFKAAAPDYDFWPDDYSASQWLARAGVTMASAKLTDAYLLRLAALHGGTLATFDRRIDPALIGAADPDVVEFIA